MTVRREKTGRGGGKTDKWSLKLEHGRGGSTICTSKWPGLRRSHHRGAVARSDVVYETFERKLRRCKDGAHDETFAWRRVRMFCIEQLKLRVRIE